MRPPNPAILAVCAILVPVLAGCSGGGVVKNPTLVANLPAPGPAPGKYLIEAGDELEINFFHTPELNVLLPVRPDGYISLPFAHEVRAAGKAPEQLRVELTNHYRRELTAPEIAVIVRTFSAQQVHVGGEVDTAGTYPLVGSMTVLESIFAAGGWLRTARLNEVLVIRRDSKNRSYMVIPVDLTTVIDGTDTSQNIALAPYDVVFVPTSPIADVNTFIDLYIRQNIPINFGYRFVPFDD